ncbi:lytic transglycosylase domain-containing protein [Flavobacteriaceae bacterium]|jgi:membrane-bound lytic murein transglycosylase D|nr:lytic transglycosylase domain-containing protein [Flavobacterium sp.]MDB4252650.1 lytic transglycosylase domain-containing protein [Flavobacteriaceae bacterium]
MQKIVRFLSIIFITLLSITFFNAVYISDVPSEKNTADSYTIKALKIPDELTFAGEKVPTELYDIKERMDRELLVNTYWQSNGLLLIKRAHKYFPIIEPMLKKYGIPDDFKYLAVAESGLENNSSSAGAAGFWHFLKSSAKEYGLEVNQNVDERYNLEKATKVAADYLKKSKKRFGTWTLAAAAYNAGNARIARNLKKQQVTDYYDLLLNSETSRYVLRIVALKEVLSYPKKYGFEFEKEDLYTSPATRTVKVDTVITNIASFAKGFNTNYKELKLHNAWLRENKLNNKSRKLYKITIPIK